MNNKYIPLGRLPSSCGMRCLFLLFFSLVALLPFALFADDRLIIDQATFFKPVRNSMASIVNGDPVVYDNPASPEGTFFGVFHLRFKLDKNNVHYPCKIIVYAQKNSDSPTWRKIAEVTPDEKPSEGDWDVSFFWDSASASYDWDGAPFKENLKIRLKLISN